MLCNSRRQQPGASSGHMAHCTLLRILDDLSSDELRSFVFYLPELPGQPSCIPRGKLDNADRVRLAELLLKYYPGRELEVAAQVLHEVPRRDLLKKYRLRGQEGAPSMEATPEKAPAAGSYLQGQELPVSEKTKETTLKMAGVAETTPAARRVSEKDLMKLARNLGKNWRAIGIEFLGVEASRLEQIEEENPGNAIMRNFYMLKSWKNCEGEKATPDRLYLILAQDEVPLDQEAIEFLRSS